MKGAEPTLISEYVETGEVKLVFWPVLNHGNASVYSTVTMECIGQQRPDLAWDAHSILFDRQRDLWRAEMDYYVDLAGEFGVDQDLFATCYTSPDTLTHIQALDQTRKDRGITGQPIFDINGEGLILGSQPIDVFVDAISFVQEQNQ